LHVHLSKPPSAAFYSYSYNMMSIPKTCSAGVVAKFGADFQVEVQEVTVPEPGK
jgi:hypothetical protein